MNNFEENLDRFRENLKTVRQAKGLSGAELSEACELRVKKRINDIEDGRGKPTLEEVIAICGELGVPMGPMLCGNVRVKFKFVDDQGFPLNSL